MEATQNIEEEKASDDVLLAHYVAGDQSAFEALYAAHKGPVYRFFLRQLPEEAAHDAFQETWTKLIAAAPAYKPEGKFRSFLFTIAYNVLHDWQRKQMRTAAQVQEQVDTEALVAELDLQSEVEEAQLAKLLRAQVRALPIAQRAVWLLRQESELGLGEIAALTNSTLEGVKSRLRYANQKLKSGMQKYVR